MQVRNDSPFPTIPCDECGSNVPTSTDRDVCTSCSNFRQLFGRKPSNVDRLDVSDVSVVAEYPTRYGYTVTVDGDTDKYQYHDRDNAEFRRGEKRSAAWMWRNTSYD